jgi:hypothetical protein
VDGRVVNLPIKQRPAEVDLSVGATFKAYRVKYSDGYGSLMLRYEDKKGRPKAEIHQIANELPSR